MRTLFRLLSLPLQWLRRFRATFEARTTGDDLRAVVKNLRTDEVHEARTAFGLTFQNFPNRARQQWLQANEIRVIRRPGRTVRQDQQAAAMNWFDGLHGKGVK